ncbi:MAG: hypothetical protein MUF11_12970 [Beijerinckiaceae bacterium]|nr:hypothetical protein [Beijerinckiaceae bacterium]
MNEKELVRRVIDFAFIVKSQLHSDDTSLLRSIMNILIMEAEDVIEDMETKEADNNTNQSDQRFGST